MLDAMKFVKSGVGKAKSDITMKHYRIKGGRILSTNGIIALSSPIPVGIDCQPEAVAFTKAISQCTEPPVLTLTDAGRLRIASGKLKVFVDCYKDNLYGFVPEGDIVPVNPDVLMSALEKTLPFICSDPSQPWSNGVLLRGKSLFATNNNVIIEVWVGDAFPHDINLPAVAVDRLIAIGEPFTKLQVSKNSATFHFSGDRWMKTLLLSTQWPPIDRAFKDCRPKPFPPDFYDGLLALSKFKSSDKVRMRFGGLHTEGEEDKGASYAVDGLTWSGVYRLDMLKAVREVADTADFSVSPAQFYGNMLRGAIVGFKDV